MTKTKCTRTPDWRRRWEAGSSPRSSGSLARRRSSSAMVSTISKVPVQVIGPYIAVDSCGYSKGKSRILSNTGTDYSTAEMRTPVLRTPAFAIIASRRNGNTRAKPQKFCLTAQISKVRQEKSSCPPLLLSIKSPEERNKTLKTNIEFCAVASASLDGEAIVVD